MTELMSFEEFLKENEKQQKHMQNSILRLNIEENTGKKQERKTRI